MWALATCKAGPSSGSLSSFTRVFKGAIAIRVPSHTPAVGIMSSGCCQFSSGAKGYKVVLKDGFLQKYQTKKPPFGFNGLGEFVYRRTYARKKPDGQNEEWCVHRLCVLLMLIALLSEHHDTSIRITHACGRWETVRRVVEGTFSLQYKWATDRRLGWNHNRVGGVGDKHVLRNACVARLYAYVVSIIPLGDGS